MLPRLAHPSRLFLHEAHQCRSRYGRPAQLAQSIETLGKQEDSPVGTWGIGEPAPALFGTGPKERFGFEHSLIPRSHRGPCHQLNPSNVQATKSI
jgi:hypothetical protein